MQVIVEFPDPKATEMRAFAERRVRFSMRRLSWLVPRVKVHLSDVNGPRGGVDKRCQVQLLADGRPDVVVTSVARDWRSALQSALGRAVRSLLHNWQRSHKQPSVRPAAIKPELSPQAYAAGASSCRTNSMKAVAARVGRRS